VHSGYGSNVTFNTALLSGLNALFGTPFSPPELWDILTRNFVENADDEYVYWGLDTGVGEACVLYGGLVWVDEHARYIGSATAHLWVVTATGDPKVLAGRRGREGFGDVEELDTLQECLEYQAEYGERLLRHLEHRMKPHLLRDDVRGLLGEGWEMNRIGHHRILERFWGTEIMDRYQETARSAGALYAAMSSIGPSVLALADTEDQAERVRDAMAAALSETHSNFQIGRAGEKLRIEIED
jgi:predicted sugar kinase